jgi:hypothetical protein
MTHHLYIFNERQLNDFDGDKTRQEMTNTLLKSHLSYYKIIIYIHTIYKTTKRPILCKDSMYYKNIFSAWESMTSSIIGQIIHYSIHYYEAEFDMLHI